MHRAIGKKQEARSETRNRPTKQRDQVFKESKTRNSTMDCGTINAALVSTTKTNISHFIESERVEEVVSKRFHENTRTTTRTTTSCGCTNTRDAEFLGDLQLQRVVTFEEDHDEQNGAEQENQYNLRQADSISSGKARFNAVAATRISQYYDDDEHDDGNVDNFIVWSLEEDFALIRKLGKGGAATVYEARQVQSGHHVALKAQCIDDGLAESEIDIHESIPPHDNIVSFYDFFYSDSYFGKQSPSKDETDWALPGRRFVYFILELCSNGSLYDVLPQKTKCRVENETQAAVWIQQAMHALQHVHAQDILHCDVKTANFVIASSNINQLKLTDFGFAVRKQDIENDDVDVDGGSILYMAPEHLIAWRDGLSMCSLDEGIDVYGLGAVLFEILVGEMPYVVLEEYDDGEDAAEAMEDLASCWDGCDLVPHVIDLPALTIENAKQLLPPPCFPEFVSDEVQDLICSMLQPLWDDLISLEQALRHPWIQKHCCFV